jgi:hypothetical protein
MSTAARLSQSVTVAAANTAVTLQMPSIIVNNTAAAGNVAYHLVDDAVGAFVIEWFGAGEEKRRRADIVGGTGAGTTVATVLVLES